MRLVRPVVLVVAAAAVALAPTAAHADRHTHPDPAGDVVSTAGEAGTTTPQPTRTNGDIVSSTVIHKGRRVVLQLQYVDLAPSPETHAHAFVLRTPSMRREIDLVATDSVWGGRVFMIKPGGTKVRCHVRKKLDYEANTATVAVPRSCLGNPRWVRVGMANVTFTGFDAADTQYIDDAQATGIGTRPVLGPKVRR
jgi:hypothetical protein